jgi:hypothetical protein
MKKFFYTLAWFFIPLLIIPILEAFVFPVSQFTYRSWEALRFYKFGFVGPFYPNEEVVRQEEGDLAHHTSHAVSRKTLWVTDQVGYRNEHFINAPDILLIGDSYIAGSGLSQEQLLSNVLSKKLGPGVKIYNLAPAVFSQFDSLYQENYLEKPKLIIYSCAERDIPAVFKGNIRSRKSLSDVLAFHGNIDVYMDRMLRLYSLRWVKSRLLNSTGAGIVSPSNPDMFFLSGRGMARHSEDELKQAAAAIVSYKRYCDSMNIGFLFMPMPEKETVYYKLVPLTDQPDYLTRLDSLLGLAGVATINTLSLYNRWLSVDGRPLLYQLDDTHWSHTGVELVADEITRSPIVRSAVKK